MGGGWFTVTSKQCGSRYVCTESDAFLAYHRDRSTFDGRRSLNVVFIRSALITLTRLIPGKFYANHRVFGTAVCPSPTEAEGRFGIGQGHRPAVRRQ